MEESNKFRGQKGQQRVQPVRSMKEIENINFYLLNKKETAIPKRKKIWARNLFLWKFGINCSLRIGDILRLKVKDVNKGYINIKDQKTGKINQFEISKGLIELCHEYIEELELTDEEYLIKNFNKPNQPITKQALHANLFKKIEKDCGLSYPINTHTMRKTFGYHFFQKTKDINLLKEIFNHSSIDVTQKYICILDDDKNKARKDFTLGL